MPRVDNTSPALERVVNGVQRVAAVARNSATIIKVIGDLTDTNFTSLGQRVREKFSTPLRELLGARSSSSLYEGKGTKYPQSVRLGNYTSTYRGVRPQVKQIGPGRQNYTTGNIPSKHGPTIKLAFVPKAARGSGLDYILDSYKSYRKDRFPSHSARRNYHTGKRYKRMKRKRKYSANLTLKARCARKGNRPKECKQFRY